MTQKSVQIRFENRPFSSAYEYLVPAGYPKLKVGDQVIVSASGNIRIVTVSKGEFDSTHRGTVPLYGYVAGRQESADLSNQLNVVRARTTYELAKKELLRLSPNECL